MKINKQTFNLNEELIVSINQEDNDGLINIPKNINLDINIVNYFGKIVINSISINHLQDEISLSKTGSTFVTIFLKIYLVPASIEYTKLISPLSFISAELEVTLTS